MLPTRFCYRLALIVLGLFQTAFANEWFNVTGYLYKLSDTKKDFSDAIDDCRAQNAELASLKQQQYYLLMFAVRLDSWRSRTVWIGLSDHFVPGTYYWSDATLLGSWDRWPADSPKGQGRCVSVSSRIFSDWSEEVCSTKNYYICKANGPTTSASTTSAPTTSAPTTSDPTTSSPTATTKTTRNKDKIEETTTVSIIPPAIPSLTATAHTLIDGEDVTFTCLSSAGGFVSYEFKQGNVRRVLSDSSSFTLKPAVLGQDRGSYTCRVWVNGVSSADSNQYKLFIIPATPTLTLRPGTHQVQAGSEVSFRCETTSIGEKEYFFYKNMVPARNGVKKTWPLRMESDDSGSYSCSVEMGGEMSYSSNSYHVNVKESTDRPETTTKKLTTKPPTDTSDTGSPNCMVASDGYYVDHQNYCMYYQCAAYQMYHRKCAPGTIWTPASTSVCTELQEGYVCPS